MWLCTTKPLQNSFFLCSHITTIFNTENFSFLPKCVRVSPHHQTADTSWVSSNLIPWDSVRSRRLNARSPRCPCHRHKSQIQASRTSDQPALSWGSHNTLFGFNTLAQAAHITQENTYLYLLVYQRIQMRRCVGWGISKVHGASKSSLDEPPSRNLHWFSYPEAPQTQSSWVFMEASRSSAFLSPVQRVGPSLVF